MKIPTNNIFILGMHLLIFVASGSIFASPVFPGCGFLVLFRFFSENAKFTYCWADLLVL